jgi:FixJ family two-component response regulator/DNA-binding MarR family transcriptional regulator
VLVVDDERELLGELEIALTDCGHQCLCTTRPRDALRLLDERRDVDVVVSDIRMPEMDGLTLLSAMRERFGDRTWLQVIFITGHADVDTAVGALRLEAVDFLRKPLRRDEFIVAVNRALGNAREARRTLASWQESGQQLARLGSEAARIAEALAAFTPGILERAPSRQTDREAAARTGSKQEGGRNEQTSRERLLQLIQSRRVKAAFFSGKLFAEPIWDMLLELLECRLRDRRVSVSSLCIASAIPATTALRRIEELEKEGLVVRVPDPKDGRRQFLELTDEAARRLVGYLTALDRKLRTTA